MKEQIEEIPLDRLMGQPGNRRVGGFDKKKLEGMAESIRTGGIQLPAVVRRRNEKEGQYEIVAGERRLRAAMIAGLPTLPCLVRDMGDQEVLKFRIIENLQREDVHALDEAQAYKKLEAGGSNIEQIAKDVGKSASYVYQRLKLLDLFAEAREALASGTISAGHAILIARLTPEQQKDAAKFCLPNEYFPEQRPISVRELDHYIHDEIMIDLAKAPFKKDDAKLLPKAGACKACSRRTGASPELFPDARGKDLCLDRTCHTKKLDALIRMRRKELDSGEEEYLKVSNDYQSRKGTLNTSEWTECKKKEDGAQRALIVGGTDRGKMTYAKKREGYHYERSAEDMEKERELKKEQKIHGAVQLQLWEEVIDCVKADTEESAGRMAEGLLRLVARAFYGRLWIQYQEQLCQAQGWELPPKENYENAWNRPGWGSVGNEAIAAMPAEEIPLLLIKCALIDDKNSRHCADGEEEGPLRQAARILGINTKAVEKQVQETQREESK